MNPSLPPQELVLLMGLALSLAAFWGLAAICLPGVSIPKLVHSIFRRHAMDWIWLFYVAMLAVVILLDILETRYDSVITSHLHWEFTSFFLSVEGSATGLFQALHHPWLTWLLSVIYLYVFPVMGVVAMMATYHGGEYQITRKIFWGGILNYLLIMPFYLLVPVSERWAVKDGTVALLMDQVSPLLIQGLRPLSGVNNCFPSFHTSLAFTVAMLCAASSNRRMRRAMTGLAWLILYSTLYLGFHWALDALAGLVFAAFCTVVATWAVENYPLERALLHVRAR